MQEKRKYPRFPCMLKVKFHYYDGDPDNPELYNTKPKKGKGRILDISRGGLFIASYSKTGINLPITIEFKTKKQIYSLTGIIVRTGLIKNNPAEVLKKFSDLQISEDAYLAIKFEETLNDLDSSDLQIL
jgi:hypothetical protein